MSIYQVCLPKEVLSIHIQVLRSVETFCGSRDNVVNILGLLGEIYIQHADHLVHVLGHRHLGEGQHGGTEL